MLTSKNWTRENLAWAAGFLDGEGSFPTFNKKTYLIIQIQAGQNLRDRDSLEKLQSILGGTITGPYKHGMLMWGIYRQIEVYAAIMALYPWMSKRRKLQIENQIEAFKKRKRAR